ncbi:MAG: hypothetical protein KatS3mg015_0034 [Fimbriimonadales bacterium]|nr:MAG: hypothetical protein KatS3mg015_0034 [Fimbriimonadales bacterium]
MVGLLAILALLPCVPQPPMASGTVFEDLDRDGVRDAGEPGIPRVRVSNGEQIVSSDRDGRWRLPYDDDTIFFVIKPAGWMTPVDENNLPKFYRIHKPNGSPRLRYGGVAPTGPLPASIDFPLYRRPEGPRFSAILLGDTQTRDIREVGYLREDILDHLVGTDALFGMTLGDLVFDDLDVLGPYKEAVGRVGIPWYNVLGNHDMNYDAEGDEHSDETFERHFGPSTYSFDVGHVHFVVLDNVYWTVISEGRRSYVGGLSDEQFHFLEADLRGVPADRLVVLTMHIPIPSMREGDRKRLLGILSKHPHTLSVSAHTHTQEHVFLKEEDGFTGPVPHHHVINVTASGSWWQGSPDERGVPHTTMRDGAPNGWSVFRFDGNRYEIDFYPASRPATWQMNIEVRDRLKRSDEDWNVFYVNVFAGSERSTVRYRLDREGPWEEMEHVRRPDPWYARLYERDRSLTAPYRPLPAPSDSTHLWEGRLPESLKTGAHLLEVETTDMFGRTFRSYRSFTVGD